MKLGRTCAAAAVLGVAALPFAVPVSWAGESTASVSLAAQQTETRPGATDPAPEPRMRPTDPAPVPEPTRGTAPVPEPTRGAVPVPRDQVNQRPVGAPDTGGDPADPGLAPVVIGGGAILAAGGIGTALVLRRRAGEN